MRITLTTFAKSKVIVVALVCAITLTVQASDDKKAKAQEEVQNVANKTLQQLYKAQPAAKAAVQHAAGYAVFNNMGVKILLAGSGKGKGFAANNKTKKVTYMKMIEVQAGLGIGVEKFSVVFDNDKVLDNFINSGWEFGGQASAAAKTATKGGAMSGAASVSDGVWMYQLTEKGLAAEITATGTKYYKDDDLN